MWLMARKIKAMGIKMVLSGEGADEILGGYLYFHKAPDARAFHEETVRKLHQLHKFDCLRANKSMAAWGIEARVPFLYPPFLDVAMRLNPSAKMCTDGRMEKHVLRAAFEGLIPDEVLWRQKEQFSDGVGYGWIDQLKEHAESKVTDEQLGNASHRFLTNPPLTKEAYFFVRFLTNSFHIPMLPKWFRRASRWLVPHRLRWPGINSLRKWPIPRDAPCEVYIGRVIKDMQGSDTEAGSDLDTDLLLASFEHAKRFVYELDQPTPLVEVALPSGRVAYLKREDCSNIFSYKWRGAYNKMRSLVETGNRGPFVAASAGNHAQGVAASANALNVTAEIFMPPNHASAQAGFGEKNWADCWCGFTYMATRSMRLPWPPSDTRVKTTPRCLLHLTIGKSSVGRRPWDPRFCNNRLSALKFTCPSVEGDWLVGSRLPASRLVPMSKLSAWKSLDKMR